MCDAPEYQPNEMKTARHKRPGRGAIRASLRRPRQKPALLGFLAHGGPGERDMRAQMRAAAAAASESRQGAVGSPQPSERRVRFDLADSADKDHTLLEEGGDSTSAGSCLSADEGFSEAQAVLEMDEGAADVSPGSGRVPTEAAYSSTAASKRQTELLQRWD
mmetsp:Transcript_26416/g.61310  ORF Transcript_26416/g.61310 Transcript_26416/m.61310 type:complete len:162 (-) Transcript_26416:263-748(-)